MPDITQIALGDTIYDIKDAVARADLDIVKPALNALQNSVGDPLAVSNVSDFSGSTLDTTKIYVYTGADSGNYHQGYWYYHNGSAWVEGKEWGEGVEIDATLENTGEAAEAKATGAAIGELKSTIGYKTKIIEGAFISSSGVVTASAPATPWNLLCINLNPTDIIARIKLASISQSIVYGFFTSEPSMGSTTYDNQRIATGALSVENITIPLTCSWIAIRYNPSDYPNVLFSNIVDVNKSVLVQSDYSGDLNDIRNNGVYYASSSVLNRPTQNGAYMVVSLYARDGAFMQIAIGWSGTNYGKQYTRTYVAGAWTDWVILNVIEIKGQYSGDVDDIRNNSIYYVPSSTPGLPSGVSGAFIIQTNEAVTGAYIQTAIGWAGASKGVRFVRTYVAGAWTDWVTSDTVYQSHPYYIATGDSLMYGAKWLPIETAPYYEIVRTSYENRIPTRIASAVGANINFVNAAVGGAYYVGSGDNKILSQLQNIDLTDAKLITISGGRNDSNNPLGDKTSIAGDGTICGAIKEIIDYIYTQNKKAQIIVVQVTPNTTDNSTIFTKTYAGGWSLNSYAEKVGEMCAELNIGFVTWNGCTYLNHWVDYTGAGNNYAHPNNDEAYVQMGNFIGGKIAALYRG